MTEKKPGERTIFPRYSVEEDVDRELESHLAMRVEELMAEGLSREDAEAEALRLFGDRTTVSQASAGIVRSHEKAVRRAKLWETFFQDFRYGVRTVSRSPGFAIVAVLTLMLGIGANTAIYSVVRGVLLSPLSYEDAEELMVVRETQQRGGTMTVAWANFVDWHAENSVFEGLFAYGAGSTTVLGGEEPVTTTVARVTGDFWSVFRITPMAGRLTVEADHNQGAAPVAVVSESFWRNELGGRDIGSIALDITGVTVSVVGVIRTEHAFPKGASTWVPVELDEQSESRTAHNWRVIGRLADGVTEEQADLVMDGITKRIVSAERDPTDDFLAAGATVFSLQEEVVGSARAPLLILFGAAGLVLLVACSNLASTLLARGSNRVREFAVRASLGAGRGRLVRQLMTESIVLAALGAIAGVGMGAVIVALVKRLGPESVPRLDEVGIDAGVVLFATAVAAGTVVLFGLFPALRLAKGDSAEMLRRGSRGNAGRRGFAWTLLVGTEVALALTLLVGSGLLVRSFQTLLGEERGFDSSDVMSTRAVLSQSKYRDEGSYVRFYEELMAELESSPQVTSAGVLSSIPLGGFQPNGRLELDGDLDLHAVAGYTVASAGALEALDIPLVQGRHFDDRDGLEAPHVAIVSESFAREFWPDDDPIGRQVTGGGMDNYWEERRFARVVGVVGDVRYGSLGQPARPTVYFPYSQRPFRLQYSATVVAEATNGDAGSAATTLRETIRRLDSDVAVELTAHDELIGESVASREFSMLLLAGFSIVALLLAVVGIYGVVSYSVAKRTREMGIRLALGADPGGVVQLVMRSSIHMVAIGLGLGIAGALGAGRVMQGMLYGISPADPTTIAAGVLLLGGAAMLASWVPARLGTRVDPIVTMKAE